MRKSLFFLIFGGLVILPSALVSAQSNELLDKLLDEKAASFGDTVYLGLSSAGLVPETASVEESVSFLEGKQWGLSKSKDDPISLGEYSYLLMKIYDIPGGLMYSLSPGPRYACREFEYLGLVKLKPTPYRNVSGEEVIQMLGKFLEWREEHK
jgi:hypothetical protein